MGWWSHPWALSPEGRPWGGEARPRSWMSPAGLASCVTCPRAGDSVGWALLPPLLSPFGPQTGCLCGGHSRAPGCDSAGDTSGLWSHRTAHLCFSEAVACGPGFQSARILALMVTLPWGHCPAWHTVNENTDSRGVCNPSSLKHCSQQPDMGTTQCHHLPKKMKSCH